MNRSDSKKRAAERHHDHSHTSNRKLLFISFLLITCFMFVEAVGGLISHSLALLSDAGHMLSDSISLGLSFTALVVGARVPANASKTFGYRRFEILAALLNGALLLLISALIIIEAVQRFFTPVRVAGTDMLIIAAVGLVVNLLVAWILTRGETKENLNVRSAFLHVLGDTLGSAGAIAAALLINLFGWQIADPIASMFVAVIILKSGWQVTKESVNILMEGKPDNLNLEEIRQRLCGIQGVAGLHDMHIWTITSGFMSLSCHLTVTDQADRDSVLREAEQILSAYNLEHSTIQIEGVGFATCHSDCSHQRKQA